MGSTAQVAQASETRRVGFPAALSQLAFRYWRMVLALVAVWTFFAIIFTPQSYLVDPRHTRSFAAAFTQNLIAFYPWIFISPFIVWVAGRFPLVRGQWPRNLLIQFLISLPVSFGHVLVIRMLFRALGVAHELAPLHMTVLVAGAFDLFVYWAIAAVGQGIRYYRAYEEREYRLTQAQLQILTGQLQPHFLFNTLNAATELVYEDPATADRVLTSLSDLLRLSLRQTSVEVALQHDLQFVYKYIDIQKELLRERLTIEYDIDSAALTVAVPAMMLQPIVENAVKHGLAGRAGGGSVIVRAQRSDKSLLLEVSDTGAGVPTTTNPAGGIGLANTRARLAQLYGDQHSFEAGAGPDGGFCVSIRIPWREMAQ
jgi:signal transduction histidine kinase